ncbi:MAG: AmmeMemoRadiSam system protein B, partial [Fidelibacterota bacterium]
MNHLNNFKNQIRPAAVAGMFYPNDPIKLRDQLELFLQGDSSITCQVPSILIVPHAGYVYSGIIAGKAYQILSKWKDHYSHVAILGPPHREYLTTIGASAASEFQTPLGNVKLDTGLINKIVKKMDSISFSDRAHSQEHSLEVQLPFLQFILNEFKLLPFLIGDVVPESVSQFIEILLKNANTLVVISTDLSHYLPYEEATDVDENTAEHIEAMNYFKITQGRACGIWALRGALLYAKKNNLNILRISLQNSGDTAGSKDQVVGYGSWVMNP